MRSGGLVGYLSTTLACVGVGTGGCCIQELVSNVVETNLIRELQQCVAGLALHAVRPFVIWKTCKRQARVSNSDLLEKHCIGWMHRPVELWPHCCHLDPG